MPWNKDHTATLRKLGVLLRRLIKSGLVFAFGYWLNSTLGILLMGGSAPFVVYYAIRTGLGILKNYRAICSIEAVLVATEYLLAVARKIWRMAKWMKRQIETLVTKILAMKSAFGRDEVVHVSRQYAHRCQGCGSANISAFYRAQTSVFLFASYPLRTKRDDVTVYCEYCYEYHYETSLEDEVSDEQLVAQ